MAKVYGIHPAEHSAVPATPTGLVADFTAASFFIFSWDDGGDSTLWTVYVNGVPLTPVNVNSAVVGDLTPATAYTIQLQAFNTLGSSGLTAPEIFTTDVNAPPQWFLNDQSLEVNVSYSLNLLNVVEDEDGQDITVSIVSGSVPGLTLTGTVYAGTVLAPGTHSVTFDAFDGFDHSQTTVDFIVTGADTESPTIPQNCLALASGSTVTVTADPSEDNVGVVNYDVERAGAGLSFSLRATVPNFPYIESGVPDGERNYRVRARDLAGNVSDYSNVSQVIVTSTPAAPDAPIIDSILGTSASTIQIDWSDGPSGTPPTTYELDRSLSASGPWTNRFTGLTPTFFEDTGLLSATRYFYRIRGIAGAVNGPYATANAETTGISTDEADFIINVSSGKNSGATVNFNSMVPENSSTARAVQPGEIVEIAAGTHRHKNFSNCVGTANLPIKIRGPQTGQAIFRPTSAGATNYVLTLTDCRHFILDGESDSAPVNSVDGKRHGIKITYAANASVSNKENLTGYLKFASTNPSGKNNYIATRQCTLRFIEIDGGFNRVLNQSIANHTSSHIAFQCNTNSSALVYTTDPNGNRWFAESTILEHNLILNVKGEMLYLGNNSYNWVRGPDPTVPPRYIKVRYNVGINCGGDGINGKSWYDGTVTGTDSPTDNSVHHNRIYRAGQLHGGVANGGCGISVPSTNSAVYSNYVEGAGEVGIRWSINEGINVGMPNKVFQHRCYNNVLHRNGVLDTAGAGYTANVDADVPTSYPEPVVHVYNNTSVGNTGEGLKGSGRLDPAGFYRNNLAVANGATGVNSGGAANVNNVTIASIAGVFVNASTGLNPPTLEAGTADFHLTSARGPSTGTIGTHIPLLDIEDTARNNPTDVGAYEF